MFAKDIACRQREHENTKAKSRIAGHGEKTEEERYCIDRRWTAATKIPQNAEDWREDDKPTNDENERPEKQTAANVFCPFERGMLRRLKKATKDGQRNADGRASQQASDRNIADDSLWTRRDIFHVR